MMVDGSVVIMENIYRHLTDDKPAGKAPIAPDSNSSGSGTELIVQESAREVGRPVFFAVTIIIIVFAPLFALEGVEGKLFKPMALSIVLAMLASLSVALVVVPALATYAFRNRVRYRRSPLMEERLSVHPGLLFSFSQPIATRVDELLSGVKAQLAIKLFGPDLSVLTDKGREIEALTRRTRGTRDVAME